jgi:hypothetical protein
MHSTMQKHAERYAIFVASAEARVAEGTYMGDPYLSVWVYWEA